MTTTTSSWFHRDGSACERAVTILDADRASYVTARACGRCGGAGGSAKWQFTGWTCFDCGGQGTRGTETVKVYSAAKLAKLQGTAAKAAERKATKLAAKQAAAAAAADERRAAFLATHGALLARVLPYVGEDVEGGEVRHPFLTDVYRKAMERAELTDGQVTALVSYVTKLEARAAAQAHATANSRHVGAVGERITFTGTVKRVSWHEVASFGYGLPCQKALTVIELADGSGSTVTYFGADALGEEGAVVTVKATVKEHREFRGVRETRVSRPKHVEG